MERLAQEFGIDLIPESIYIRGNNTYANEWMLQSVAAIFHRRSGNKIMRVDEFQEFIKREFKPSAWEMTHNRPMTSKEKELTDKCHESSKKLSEVQRVFANISKCSSKYQGLEAYMMYRLGQLADGGDSFHAYLVEPDNCETFGVQKGALPTDPEIIATLFTSLMDLSAKNLNHPKHYFDYQYVSRLNQEVGLRFERGQGLQKFCGALINTQPVAARNDNQ